MFNHLMKDLIFFLVLSFFYQPFAYSNSMTLEGGVFWQRRNDVKISPQTGTLIAFDEYDQGPFAHYRLELNYDFGKKHEVRFLYAPLSVSVAGQNNSNFNYNGQTYLGNTPVTVDYKFNSYRIGYSYLLAGGGQNYFRLGLTGKVRDAEITFSQGSTVSTYDNVGFVPLFYYAAQIGIGPDWALFSNADFAAAKQGRAFDVALKLKRKFGSSSTFAFGIRGLEGGAENDKVLTFSFITYAVADLTFYW